MQRAHRDRGFTLIELMVVVAIIGIISGLLVTISSRTYGANAQNVSDQVNSSVAFGRLRATSTRRFHRVELKPQQVLVWQWSEFGMATPAGVCNPAAVAPAPKLCWQLIQQMTIPSGTMIWNASTVVQTIPGATPAVNAALDFNMDFKPDGSTTGGSIFITDTRQLKKFRVLVYKATGSSYARALW